MLIAVARAVVSIDQHVISAEGAPELSPALRKRTACHLDGDVGGDNHIRRILACGHHFIAKGRTNRRAGASAKRVPRWDSYGDVWLGEIAPPVDYGRSVHISVKRRLQEDTFHHSDHMTPCLCFPKAALWPATMTPEALKWSNPTGTRAV